MSTAHWFWWSYTNLRYLRMWTFMYEMIWLVHTEPLHTTTGSFLWASTTAKSSFVDFFSPTSPYWYSSILNFSSQKEYAKNDSVLIMALWGSNMSFLHHMMSLKYSVQPRFTLFFEIIYNKILKNWISDNCCSGSDPVHLLGLFLCQMLGKRLFYVKVKTFSY